MIDRVLIPGLIVHMAVDGATLSNAGGVISPPGDSGPYTVVGATAKPASNDTAWRKLGAVQSVDRDPSPGSPINIKETVDGQRPRLTEQYYVGDVPKLTVMFKRTNCEAIQLAYSTDDLTTASTQFNPGEGQPNITGWLKQATYDHLGVQTKVVEVRFSAILTGGFKEEIGKETDVTMEFTELYNILNTGVLRAD